jgi:hypothetical protein
VHDTGLAYRTASGLELPLALQNCPGLATAEEYPSQLQAAPQFPDVDRVAFSPRSGNDGKQPA